MPLQPFLNPRSAVYLTNCALTAVIDPPLLAHADLMQEQRHLPHPLSVCLAGVQEQKQKEMEALNKALEEMGLPTEVDAHDNAEGENGALDEAEAAARREKKRRKAERLKQLQAAAQVCPAPHDWWAAW